MVSLSFKKQEERAIFFIRKEQKSGEILGKEELNGR